MNHTKTIVIALATRAELSVCPVGQELSKGSWSCTRGTKAAGTYVGRAVAVTTSRLHLVCCSLSHMVEVGRPRRRIAASSPIFI